jgi:hypothetical protein
MRTDGSVERQREAWLRSVCRMLCVLLLVQASGLPALAAEAASGETGGARTVRAVVAAVEVVVGRGEAVAAGLWEMAVSIAPATAETGRRVAQPVTVRPTAERTESAARPAPGEVAPVVAPGAVPPPQPPGLPSLTAVSSPAATAASSLDSVPLLPTINLVSLPKEPPDPSPAAVLAPIPGRYEAVYAFDACDPLDPWKVYDPANPAASDLAALDHTQGFWIAATEAATLPVAGTQPAATEVPLCAGWNLVGYPLAQERPPLAALSSIADRLVRVYGFDPSDPADPWEVFDPAVPPWVSDLDAMRPGRGYWVLVSAPGTLRYENEGAPPAVELSAPVDLAEVTAPAAVVGTVTSGLLAGWTLGVRPAGEAGPFVEIAAGDTPVAAATLGTLDPTLRLNGLYELRLQATDFAGQVAETSITVAVEGQQKIGHFSLSFSDLEVPVSGLPIQVVRTYDSRDTRPGDFGAGWTLDIRQGSYRNNRPPGDGCGICPHEAR